MKKMTKMKDFFIIVILVLLSAGCNGFLGTSSIDGKGNVGILVDIQNYSPKGVDTSTSAVEHHNAVFKQSTVTLYDKDKVVLGSEVILDTQLGQYQEIEEIYILKIQFYSVQNEWEINTEKIITDPIEYEALQLEQGRTTLRITIGQYLEFFIGGVEAIEEFSYGFEDGKTDYLFDLIGAPFTAASINDDPAFVRTGTQSGMLTAKEEAGSYNSGKFVKQFETTPNEFVEFTAYVYIENISNAMASFSIYFLDNENLSIFPFWNPWGYQGSYWIQESNSKESIEHNLIQNAWNKITMRCDVSGDVSVFENDVLIKSSQTTTPLSSISAIVMSTAAVQSGTGSYAINMYIDDVSYVVK